MIRELSLKEKQEYDRLTRFCTQLTLEDFSDNKAIKKANDEWDSFEGE